MAGIEDVLYVSDTMATSFPEIVNAHRTHCPPGWEWKHAGGLTDTYNLWLVTDGRGSMELDVRTYDLEPGDCFLLRMWEPCRGQHDPARPLTVPWIVFRMPATGLFVRQCPQRHRRLWNPSLLVEIMDRAIRSHLDAKASATAARDWLRAALHLLAEEDKRIQQVGSEATHAANIQRICESICLHPGLPHRVADLARQAHCCPGHFARLFKAHTGVTPREFITKTRIDAAQGLLRMSGHTIAEIADELGYCDVAHFSRQFRQRTGYSPSDYRHEWPAKRVAPS